MQKDVPESFGAYLRREREIRDITLSEISEFTRIKKQALQDIENENFGSLPPPAFIRAFIRCYADYLGLNVQEVMLRFDAYAKEYYPEISGEVPLVRESPKPKQRYLPVILLILAVIVAAVSFWLTRMPRVPGRGGSDLAARDTAAAVTPETPSKERPPQPAPAPPAQGVQAAVEPGPGHGADQGLDPGGGASPGSAPLAGGTATEAHRVEIKVADLCWVQAYIDGKKDRMVMLAPSESATFTGRDTVMLHIGNPDGVEYIRHNNETLRLRAGCAPWWVSFPHRTGLNHCPAEKLDE